MTVGTRSGGDALKKQELRVQAFDEKSTKLQQFWNVKSEVMTNKIDRHGIGDTCWIENLKDCPVYYPTKEDFTEDPLRYIQKIAVEASKYGICKIVSPVIASVPAGVVLSKEQSGFRFTTRLQPMRISNWDKDDKIAFPIKGRHYTLTEYEKVANRVFSRKFSTAAGLPPRFIESVFWKELVGGKTRTVEYATDVDGSAFSTSKTDPLGQSKWNLKGISRLPDSTLRLLKEAIPGVTEPMLYIGMLFSMFAWHVEDHYLYSINYQHCGAPKTWYGVPGDAALHFEKVVKEHVYSREFLNDTGKGAELDLLLEKTTMFAPKILTDHGVPVFKAVQYPGEFIITFPRAYHAGFSHGFNCGEAVNFAMADWIPFGAEACLRYEFLNRLPLLPHDELLCKEATIIDRKNQIGHKDSLCKQQACVMMAFVALMQSHQQVKSAFERQGAKTTMSPVVDIYCGLCKHKCYVGYTHCKCFPEPTCFNHGDFFSSCSCEGDRIMFLRDDFVNLQLAAQKYEHKEEIRKQAQKLVLDGDAAKQGDGTLSRGTSECFESSLLTNAVSSREACEKQEDREDACSGSVVFNLETSGVFAMSNCRKAQEEESEESDTEVLKIKRRRVASPQSKRFQVDEQEIDKSLVRSLDFGISSPVRGHDGLDRQEHTTLDKQKQTKSDSSMNGDLIPVCHVIDELNIKGSAAEVMSQWQSDARRRGLILKIKEVSVGQENLKVLSLKSLACLKHLVSREEAKVLQQLMWKVKSRRNGHGHRNLGPKSASLDKWSSANGTHNSHDEKSESSNERRDLSCVISTVRHTRLTATTEDCVLRGELHSDCDKKPSAESKRIEGLSSVEGSTMLSAETALQEVQDVEVSGVSVKVEDVPVDVCYPGSRIKDVLCDPELNVVEGGHVREEECSSSEPVSMEPEPSAPLTELVAENPSAAINAEERESSNLKCMILSSPAAELETCKSVTSHIENAEIGNGEWQGTGLADEGSLCHMKEVYIQCLRALGTENTLPDAPAEAQPLVDLELIRERNLKTGPTANAGESSNDREKPEITSTSSSVPKQGLVIYLHRKVEQPQEKATKFSHEQNETENDFDQVDIFEGQTGGDAWCLDEGMASFCSVRNEGESIPPLEQLTLMCGDDFVHHHLERNGAQERFAESFDMKADGSLGGGELSVVGHQRGKSVCSQVGSEFPIGELSHDVIKLCSNLEPNNYPMGSQQVFAEEDHKSVTLDSIKLLSHREDALPADSGKQKKVELSCKTPEFPAGLRNYSEPSDAELGGHASRFRSRSHWRESLGHNVVDKPSHHSTQSYGGFKTDPYYVGQSSHWGQQGRYDLSAHHSTGQRASRDESAKFKRTMRRSLPSLHHPYNNRDAYNNRSTNKYPYPRVFHHEEEQVPCSYWKRRANRHHNGDWRDAKSMNAGHRINVDSHHQVAGCSSTAFKETGYVEGYDPVKWEIFPSANCWHFSSTDHHVHSSRADRGLPGALL